MAVPRLFSRGRSVFARTTLSVRVAPSAISSIRTSITKREFTVSQYRREDIIQTPSRGPEISLTDARTPTSSPSPKIAFLRIPKRLTRREVEELLRSKGCTIKNVEMRVDRFTFQNNTKCFVELGSEAEATKIIEELNGSEIQGSKLILKPLKDDFVWGLWRDVENPPKRDRYFFDEGTASVLDAVRPLLEGRRLMLQVKTPGWSPNVRTSIQKQRTDEILERHFAKYGAIERVSDFSPFFGDMKKVPRLACFLDFETKEGAEKAIENIHDTEIEGRLTWLTHSVPAKWRAHQIGKLAPEALEQLQESGVVAKDEDLYEDKFVNPLPKK